MKKTFILSLMGALLLASVAEARTTHFSYGSTEVTTQIVTDTKTTNTLTANAIGQLSHDSTNPADHWIETTVTFTLNLAEVAKISPELNTQVNLVTITENGGHKVGLTIRNNNGTIEPHIIWDNGTHGSTFALPNTGSVTYSLVTGWLPNPSTGANDKVSTFLYNAETQTGIFTEGGTGTQDAYNNDSRYVTSVAVDSAYVTAFSVTNAALTLDANGIGAAATALKNASIPEPTTATLSLLALAGLAARRRRK